jgi:hypothetical protein
MARPLITKPGFYPAITCEQYFAEPCPAPALTNSGIQLLNASCPAKFAYHHPAIGQPAEQQADTAARRMGNLVHRLALGKGSDYAISPHERYQSAEAKAWKADTEAAGLMPVKQAEFDDAQIMAARIREAIEAETRGHPYETEVVIAWQITMSGAPAIWCRAMIDVWCAALNLALDVKTCADASDKAIMRAFANGYAGQHAWYADGIEALSPAKSKPRFGFLFVEKDAPFLARFAEPSEGFRHGASIANERAVMTFARCLKAGEWPSYQPLSVAPPPWWLNEIADYELEQAA